MHHSNIVINQNNCHLKCEYGDRSDLLFVENRCYEMLPSSTNIELANKHNQNSELNKINPQTNQMLTSKDLLNFAKQIATGMVRNILNVYHEIINNKCFFFAKLGILGQQ